MISGIGLRGVTQVYIQGVVVVTFDANRLHKVLVTSTQQTAIESKQIAARIAFRQKTLRG